jgi:WD40 repeat protein
MSDLTGQTLGKYHILARLGRGGMADVYQAYQPRLDRYVALKVLHHHLAEEEDFVSRFEREPATIARLRHPSIVQVFDFDVEGELYYMVMELIAGPTLQAELEARNLNNQPFALAEITQIFTALAGAIDYAHVRGMVHHDLKPGNIMFTREGEVVLTDFGLARVVGASHHTTSGSVYGTPAYMAPEQAQGERGDGRSDIYALGIILYEMVTGRLPFEANTPFNLILQHANEPPPPPTTLNPDIPNVVEQVILKTLSKNPDQRYRNAGDLAQALRDAVGLTAEAVLTAPPLAVVAPAPPLEEVSITPTPEPGRPVIPPACPYRGLYAFQEEDAPFFFGRELFTEQLVTAVHNQSIVAVIGPSGSGKSSVVYAGLVAQLREDKNWTIAAFRPGSQPFQALAAELIPLLEPDLGETDRLVQTRKLATALSQRDVSLVEVIDRSLDKHSQAGRLLLVADQFEELYTLCSDPELRHRFLDMLLEVVDIQQFRRSPSFTLVLTLRVDFLGQALSHRPFADALQDADVKLGPMTRQELGRAIANPARKQRVAFESGLVARILDDVGDEPGNLPLLEFALTALWERMVTGRLAHEAYEAIGRVEGALARYADEVFDGLAPAEQDAARRIFTQMVRPGEGTEDTRRLATRTELSEPDWTLVQQLADARLVVTGQDPAGQETVEVVHEALIRGWGRLRQWMAEDRAFRVWQERLRAVLNQWQTSDQDEGALLRGVPLAEAENWLAEREADLSRAERGFVETSLAARRQREAAERAQQTRERALEQSALQRLRVIVAVLVAASIVGITLTLVIFNQSQTNRQIAEQAQVAEATAEAGQRAAVEAQTIAATERDQALINLSRQLGTLSQTFIDNQLDLALLLSLEAYRIADSPEARGSLLAGLAFNPHLATFLRGHTDGVRSVTWSPDGQLLASGIRDGSVMLWDATTGQPLGPLLIGHTDRVTSVAFSPDGQILATASGDKSILLWDVSTAQNADAGTTKPLNPPLTGHTSEVTSLAFSPDGQTLVSGSFDQTIILWDVATRQPLGQPLTGHKGSVWSVAFSPDGETLATAGEDKTIILWDIATGQPLDFPLVGHTAPVYSIAFSPDGQTLTSAGRDRSIILWDVPNRQPLGPPLLGHRGSVRNVAFSPTDGGRTLISSGDDDTVIIWNVSTLLNPDPNQNEGTGSVASHPIWQPLSGHTDDVWSVVFSPDGNQIASGSDDGTIVLWDVDPVGLVKARLVGHQAPVVSLAFSTLDDVQLLASGSCATLTENKLGCRQGEIRLWNIGTGQPLSLPLNSHNGWVNSVAFSPDGQTLASASEDQTIILWDIATSFDALNTGESADSITVQPRGSPLTGHNAQVLSVTFSPDGRRLASSGAIGDPTIILWDVETGQPVGSRLTGHNRAVNSVTFSPDGLTLASGSGDNTIILWDTETGQPLGPPLTDPDPIRSLNTVYAVEGVAFSPGAADTYKGPSGHILASTTTGGKIILWDVETGQPLGDPLTGHTSAVSSLAFSPDGQTLVSGSEDQTVGLWDVATGQPLGLPLTGHTNEVLSVAFSPDGQTVASGSEDTSIILWDMSLESWQARACRRANRNLTEAEWRQFFGDQPYRPTCPDLPVPEEAN